MILTLLMSNKLQMSRVITAAMPHLVLNYGMAVKAKKTNRQFCYLPGKQME